MYGYGDDDLNRTAGGDDKVSEDEDSRESNSVSIKIFPVFLSHPETSRLSASSGTCNFFCLFRRFTWKKEQGTGCDVIGVVLIGNCRVEILGSHECLVIWV